MLLIRRYFLNLPVKKKIFVINEFKSIKLYKNNLLYLYILIIARTYRRNKSTFLFHLNGM